MSLGWEKGWKKGWVDEFEMTRRMRMGWKEGKIDG